MSARDEIRQAMERLLTGAAEHTDGRLTRTNLALEAGIGRATLYRQPDLLAEWIRRVDESDTTECSQPGNAATIVRLTRQLEKERTRRRESDQVADGLALVVAELYRQLEAMRSDTNATIVPINTAAQSRRRHRT